MLRPSKHTGRWVLMPLICLFLFTSCRSWKEKRRLKKQNVTVNTFNQALHEAALEWEYFSSKAKTQFKDNKNNHSLTVNLKMKKDSVIWASVTAVIGLEVARVKITPDKVQIMDKLGRRYIEKPYDMLKEYTKAEISIGQLQSLLLGQPIMDVDSYEWKEKDETVYFVSSRQNNLENFLSVLLGENLVMESKIQNILTGTQILAQYGSPNKEFPKLQNKVNLGMSEANQQITVNLEHTRVNLDPISSFPFRVPSSYEKMD